jgi:hypothetical protein
MHKFIAQTAAANAVAVRFIAAREAQTAWAANEDAQQQSARNKHLHSAATHALARKLQRELSAQLNSEGYVNVRKRFIAVKIRACLYKVTAPILKQLFALASKHNAELVFTDTNSLILRLRNTK